MTFTIDTTLPEQIFYINRQMLKAYAEASGDFNPIHLDEEFAKSVGLPNVIAHGMLTMALAGEAVRRWMADGYSEYSIVDFTTRFTKPVIVPADTEVAINFGGKVLEVGETDISLEVSAISNGVKVLGQTKVRLAL